MGVFNRIISIICSTTFLLILSTNSAFAAGGTMTYVINGSNQIPSLTTNMLIVLSVLLFLVAFKVAKQKGKVGAKMFTLIVGACVLSISSGGFKLISDLQAGGDVPTAIHLDASGSVTVTAGQYLFANENYPSGITITGVFPDEGSVCGLATIEVPPIGRRPPPTTANDYPFPVPLCGEVVYPGDIPSLQLSQPLDGRVLNIERACILACRPIIDPDPT